MPCMNAYIHTSIHFHFTAALHWNNDDSRRNSWLQENRYSAHRHEGRMRENMEGGRNNALYRNEYGGGGAALEILTFVCLNIKLFNTERIGFCLFCTDCWVYLKSVFSYCEILIHVCIIHAGFVEFEVLLGMRLQGNPSFSLGQGGGMTIGTKPSHCGLHWIEQIYHLYEPAGSLLPHSQVCWYEHPIGFQQIISPPQLESGVCCRDSSDEPRLFSDGSLTHSHLFITWSHLGLKGLVGAWTPAHRCGNITLVCFAALIRYKNRLLSLDFAFSCIFFQSVHHCSFEI